MMSRVSARSLGLAAACLAFPSALGAQGMRLDEDRALVDHVAHSGGGDVLLGDLNGDGNLDWVHYGGFPIGNPVSLGQGDGRFVLNGVGLPETPLGDLVDIDGDGALDLILRQDTPPPTTYRLVLAQGDGSGGFTTTPVPGLPGGPSGQVYPMDVAAADLEGDGDIDLVVLDRYEGTRAYLAEGAGFSSQPPPTTEITSLGFLELADVDGDGDLDLLEGRGSGEFDELYRNDSGTLAPLVGAIPDTIGISTFDAAFGDCDGDGDLDLLLARHPSAAVLLNDGTGVYTEAPDALGTLVEDGYSAELADLDLDGHLDAFVCTDRWIPEYLGAGDGAGGFAPVPNALDGYEALHTGSAVADVNGDGDPDLLLAGMNDELDRVFLGDGAFGLRTRIRRGRIPYDAKDAAVADFDLDGDQDVMTGTHRVFANDGSGDFLEIPGAAPAGDTALILSGDVDGDGDPDALSGEWLFPSNEGMVLLGQGDGTFSLSTAPLPSIGGEYKGGGFADMDGDGDLDLMVSLPFVYYFLNDGGGGFTDAPDGWGPYWLYGGALGLADFDLDGDTDVWASDGYYENPGNGDISVVEEYTQLKWKWDYEIAVADADGDLDPDVVVVHPEEAGNDALWRFEGSGFTKELLPGTPRGTRMIFEDLDGDLDRDLLIESCDEEGFVSQLLTYTNDGTGSFAIVPNPFDSESILQPGKPYWTSYRQHWYAFDADADGDVDLLSLPNKGPYAYLYTNRLRHTVQLPSAVLGEPVSVEINGPANEPWALVLSTAPASIPLPPFGLLQVDLGLSVGTWVGQLEGDGSAFPSFPVPDQPAITGAMIHWQSAVGTTFQLTNRDSAEILP